MANTLKESILRMSKKGHFPSLTLIIYCVKSVRIRSYSGPHFLAFRVNTERYSVSPYSVRMRENADPNNSEYGHFLRSDRFQTKPLRDQVGRSYNVMESAKVSENFYKIFWTLTSNLNLDTG